VTVTFRDLWLRRHRAARATRFKLAHNLNRALWADDAIEWRVIAPDGATAAALNRMAQQSSKRQQAKRNRLRALEF
jgi:hypothetical protein